jgi:4-hydroxythreonine-4-phosphate dehydrogenase
MTFSSKNLPLLAVTCGDPAGIGPEIILKAHLDPSWQAKCRLLVIGDQRIFAERSRRIRVKVPVDVVRSPGGGSYAPGTLTLLDLADADPAEIPIGKVSAAGGKAAVDAVFKACDLAMAGEVEAVVTAPLNKAAMHLAGFDYAGHTELLAERTHAGQVRMLLVAPQLRVIHVSTHVALEEAIRRVTQERVLETIVQADAACRELGIARPRVAVAGLNPHAGEGGLFGDQEAREIQPAIEQARAQGMDVSDPQPPDTVFLRAVKGVYDIVVAMYHDQGHIPMKLLAFDQGVNVSLGLPIIRTSVDHGTAFDIAGTGKAEPASLLAAIDVAIQMVNARRASEKGR